MRRALFVMLALAVVSLTGDAKPPSNPQTQHYLEEGIFALDEQAGAAAPAPALSSAAAGPVSFVNYYAPEEFAFAHRAGETSIGVNPHTNAAMFQMILDTARVTWDGSPYPKPTWTDVKAPIDSTNDPILWTDAATGRTFVVQLQFTLLSSFMAYTDDDGDTWQLTQPPSAAPSWDHETLGSGPYGLLPPGTNPVYPRAIYYCAQSGTAFSQCNRSDDGGLTWGAQLPMNVAYCGGLHGQVAVAPNGSVWIPHKSCASRQAVYVSEQNGAGFLYRPVPGTTSARSDPKVAFDAAGRAYFVASSAGKPVVATSDNNGVTWTTPVDVSSPFTIANTEFPMVVAGDAGRAAFAFYATDTPGNDQLATFPGAWHLYVSSTYDGGQTWETVQASPAGDPVQRSCIWLQGGSNPCRNQLDFQGMAIDNQGRVLVGYADGCTDFRGNCVSGPWTGRFDSHGVVARQTTGKRMYAAFDPAGTEPLGAFAGAEYSTPVGQAVTLRADAVAGVAPYTFEWDLDDDGAFDDAAGATASFAAPTGGVHPVALRVTDSGGAVAVDEAVVRVRDASLQQPSIAWNFDGDYTCDSQGWTSGLAAPTNSWHLGGADCDWYHGLDAAGTYAPGADATLVSPGECMTLPSSLASARVDFALSGEVDARDILAVEYARCGTEGFRRLGTFGGARSGTSSVDLSSLIGRGSFRLRFRFQVVTLTVPPSRPGYRLDDVTLLTH